MEITKGIISNKIFIKEIMVNDYVSICNNYYYKMMNKSDCALLDQKNSFSGVGK